MAVAALKRAVPRTARRLPRAERREVILRGAAQVFGRRGYAGASMEEIAGAAGVTKLILYRHFASKADLYRTVLKRVAGELSEGFATRRETDGFGVGARSLLTVARANPAGFQLLWRDAGREPEFARYLGRLREEAASAVRSSLGDRVPAGLRNWAAHAVLGYLVNAVVNWLEFGDPALDEEFVRATNKGLRAGVRAWTELSGA